MKTQLKLAALALLWFFIPSPVSTCSAQGTAFTYQGRLNDGASPANGNYDLRFILYDSSAGGSQQGPILTNAATAVSNGLFTVSLDFGNQFPGASRWLEIAVRTNGAASFFTLSPQQALMPAPYAITAGSVISGGLTSGTYGNAVTLNNAANNFSGAFNGNGANLTGVNAATLGGLSAASFWKTNGNVGANPTNGAFLGTADNQPLELRVNNQRVLRMEYATNANGACPNLTAGYSGNVISNGFVGGVIGGGGSPGVPNRVGHDFATVVGGYDNTASGYASTAMGYYNIASGEGSTTMGGENRASGNRSLAAGDHTSASGYASTAMGSITSASGNDSMAMGIGTVAGGRGSTAMGYLTSASGDYSVALGVGANANHLGSFVWSDGGGIINPFSSTANNQFLISASGGVGIGLNNPASPLHVSGGSSNPQMRITQVDAGNYARLRMNVSGSPSWEMDVGPGATPSISWWTSTLRMNLDYNGNLTTTGTVNGSSDRNAKENFASVSARDVLEKVTALPITEWNYKTDADTLRHIGPMAQDFYAAFNVGTDDKHISMVDADGVALAAIQGLNQKMEAGSQNSDARIRKLEKDNAALRQELEEIKQLLSNITQKGNQP